MAENPKVNLALVNNIPDGSLEQGTIYMSPDVSGNFIKVAVTDSSTVTIFDGSSYATKQYVIDNEYVVATALTDLNSRVDNIDLFTEKMKGGTAGQLLVKDSSTDYDMSWRTVNIGSQIVYDSSNKVISLKDVSGNVLGTPIDATDFIKDGMVSDVSVYDGNLVISFNTDAGKEDISIPLSHIFDSSNYYTKSESDTKYVWDSSSPWEPGRGVGSAQLKGSGADASGYYSVAEGDCTTASGASSHAEGEGTIASGESSHTEGHGTTASGNYSHAEGETTRTIGIGSHAEGAGTIASGDRSHAEGESTRAFGVCSHAEGYDTSARGSYSHAEGYKTDASGNYSHAEGNHAKAYGNYSHAEGTGATASGDYSHAEGDSATASAHASHAEGEATKASGGYSHAEGTCTDASGNFSHAEGENTRAFGYASHAEGFDTSARGIYSHTEGYKTDASGNYSHAEGRNTIASGQNSHAEGYATRASEGSSHAEGERTTAFGIGSHAEGCDASAIGYYSHAEGSYTIAYGEYSHAEGDSATASGNFSHAEGRNAKANGNYSHAEGFDTSANGDYSHAEGSKAKANGQYSHAEGANTTASSSYSHAEGRNTTASNQYSHAEGEFATASGYASHAEGVGAIARSNYSHAEGSYTNTYGQCSHAEGGNTAAHGAYSHAEGNNTDAQGQFSHAEGSSTVARGSYSHAEGSNTNAQGGYSHAEGSNTVTSNPYEHAQGIFNFTESETIFSIGIGSEASRKNIMTVNKKKLYINKVGNYKGGSVNDKYSLDYVLSLLALYDPEYDYIFNGGEIPPLPHPVTIPDNIEDYLIYTNNFETVMGELAERYDYANVESFMDDVFNDPDDSRWNLDKYQYYDDINIDGTTYQLWEWLNNSSQYYGLLKPDSLQTMTDNSKETDLDNDYCPFIALLNEDNDIVYDANTRGFNTKNNLVCLRQKNAQGTDIKDYYIYVSNFGGDLSGMARWAEEYGYSDINDFLEDLFEEPDIFWSTSYYYDQNIEFDGETYQLWRDTPSDTLLMLLKPDDTPEYMAMHSIEADYHNKYCPFVALINEDMDEVLYDVPNHMAEKYRLLCFREK